MPSTRARRETDITRDSNAGGASNGGLPKAPTPVSRRSSKSSAEVAPTPSPTQPGSSKSTGSRPPRVTTRSSAMRSAVHQAKDDDDHLETMSANKSDAKSSRNPRGGEGGAAVEIDYLRSRSLRPAPRDTDRSFDPVIDGLPANFPRFISHSLSSSTASTLSGSQGPEREIKHGLDQLRAAHGSSHDIIHNVDLLMALYQERLGKFEAQVAKMLVEKEELSAWRMRKVLDVPESRAGSFLILAVKQRQREAIRLLTGNHPDMQIRDSIGKSVTMVEPNARGQLGRTALFEAALWGDHEVVKWILNYRQGWELPFDSAAGIGLEEVDISLGDRTNITPLMVAVEKQHEDVVKFLTSGSALQHHPNVAVSLRCANKDKKAEYIDAQNGQSQTALTIACQFETENLEIVNHLLKAQADVSSVTGGDAMTPLHYACKHKHIQLVATLLKNNANPNTKDLKQRTPLHLAVDHDEPPIAIVASLLSSNAHVLLKDKDGNTPLHNLFMRKKAILESSDMNVFLEEGTNPQQIEQPRKKYAELAALEETINLILGPSTKMQKKLLELKNNAGFEPFGEDDKDLHFKQHRTDLLAVVREKRRESGEGLFDEKTDEIAASDDTLLGRVLIQQAVSKRWIMTCRSSRIKEAVVFVVVLVVFIIFSVARLGFFGEQAVVNGGLKQSFLKTKYGPGSDSENYLMFEDIRSAGDFLFFVEGIIEEIGAGGKKRKDATSPLSLHSSGLIIGAPVLKQWRAKVSEECVRDLRHQRTQTCFLADEFSLRFSPGFGLLHTRNATCPLLQSRLQNASSATHLSGDLGIPRGDSSLLSRQQILPPSAFSAVLPVEAERNCDLNAVPECPLVHPTEESLRLVRILSEEVGWTDNRTRALGFEVALYSHDWDRLTLVQLLAEFPPGAGVRTNPRIRTFKINSWNFRSNWLIALEVALVCFAIPLVVMVDIFKSEFVRVLRSHTWSTIPWSISRWFFLLVDLCCVYYCFRVGNLEIIVNKEINFVTWDNTGSYQSMHLLTNSIDNQVHAVAFVALLLWTKLIQKAKAFRNITILISAIRQMLGELISFFSILIIIYFGFGTTKFLVPRQDGEVQTFLSAIVAEFWASIDGELASAGDDETATNGLLGPVFAVLVTIILMNVLVTMMEDIYAKAQEDAEASWCLEQAMMVFDFEQEKKEAQERAAKRKGKEADEISAVSAQDASSNEHPKSPLALSGLERFRWGVGTLMKNNRFAKAFKLPEYVMRRDVSDLALGLLENDVDLSHKGHFKRCINEVVPEMLFFVGDVRHPSGIAENSDKVTDEIIATMHALRRIVSPKPGDGFLKTAPIPIERKHEIAEIEKKNMAQFQDLRKYARMEVDLQNHEVLQAMLVVLVMKHVSKIQVWNDQIQISKGAFESVSDFRFILFALRNEETLARFLPSYRSLSPLARNLIFKTFEADFQFGQFTQLENVPASMIALQKIGMERTTFDGKQVLSFCLFSQMLAIAGVPAFDGKLPPIMSTIFLGNIRRLQALADGEAPKQVYAKVLEATDARLKVKEMAQEEKYLERLKTMFNNNKQQQHPGGRDENTDKLFATFESFFEAFSKAILRIACMLRFNTPEKVVPLLGAALDQKYYTLAVLVHELNLSGVDDGWAILLMFCPILLQNIIKDESPTKPLTPAQVQERLVLGLHCLSYLYKKTREELELHGIGCGVWGTRHRLNSAGSDEHDVDDDSLTDNETCESEVLSDNGVYEVSCYQVATWAESYAEISKIMMNAKKCIQLEHSYTKGSLAEGRFRVQRVDK